VQGLTATRQPKLVSDDQVLVRRERQRLIATAPTEIAGLIEVRGLGLVEVPSAAEAEIRLVIDLVARELVPRMPPEAETATIRGLDVPRAVLHAFDASAPLKVLLALAAWGRPARAE
jgi:serine kinase of HPr protein (carbohydrate metabolism regulator)